MHRSTIAHYGRLEFATAQKLIHSIANSLRGRVVIQSFDKIEESRNVYERGAERSINVFYIFMQFFQSVSNDRR